MSHLEVNEVSKSGEGAAAAAAAQAGSRLFEDSYRPSNMKADGSGGAGKAEVKIPGGGSEGANEACVIEKPKGKSN
ncbi:MAG: hypothetical protein WCT03_18070 [Candidatus Obscuribacterales bacterium]